MDDHPQILNHNLKNYEYNWRECFQYRRDDCIGNDVWHVHLHGIRVYIVG